MAVEHAAEAERARARGTIDDAMLSAIAKDPATLAQGKDVFVSTCSPCHKPDGGGNIGPNLTDAYWIHGNRPTDIYKTVTDGIPAKGMPTWTPVLGEQRVEAVVAYVLSIENTNVPGGKAPQGELAAR
jgi:cytochrome c oxidase cbb3-type subunit 3